MAKIIFNLSDILKQKQLSISEAAELTNVSRPTLYDLKGGKAAGIQFETLAKLCSGLHVDPGDLIKLESDITSKTSPVRLETIAA